RSSLVWKSAGMADAGMDLPESAGGETQHRAEIKGLSPEKNYDFFILSHLPTSEVHEFGPVKVQLFVTAVNECLEELERAHISRTVREVLWELRHKKPDQRRIAELLGVKLDAIRVALGLIKPISREFFSSREVFADAKVKIYETLKTIEHLERLA